MNKINTDQISSLVRSMILLIGSILTTYGFTKAAGIINSESFIGIALTIATLITNHYYHGDNALKARLDKAGLRLVNKLGSPVLLLLLGLGITGCATAAYNADKATVIRSRTYGLHLTPGGSSTSGTPEVVVGYCSSTIYILPVSTNQLYVTPIADTFNNTTEWAVNGKITEYFASGTNLEVAIPATNVYSITNKK